LDRAEAIAEEQVPAIFISHSSLDPEIADDIKSAFDRFGFEQVFLDFDKATGIGAGENWEKRLYEELSWCHAVILMLTPTQRSKCRKDRQRISRPRRTRSHAIFAAFITVWVFNCRRSSRRFHFQTG
jgi:TIR domain